ncbi:hypothetical protein [Acinetobacter sp. CFCC 10889]|uniref:hypothetical protein n=1 Tax=Acinetobacter sp. CFCC 10889 TaxID=1775557 RepID=UPI000DD0BD80|nr:hypothetical protein [Acinetobacter sp. CFCC 10889]
MPTANIDFPWMSYYGNYNSFKRKISNHNKVINVVEVDVANGLFDIIQENRTLRIFICECYSFGVAEYEEALEHFENLDAIIINSTWCEYTPEVKEYCKEQRKGVFNLSEFFGAINFPSFWNYVSPDER